MNPILQSMIVKALIEKLMGMFAAGGGEPQDVHERYYRLGSGSDQIRCAYYFADRGTRDKVIWFFHGFGSSEKTWCQPDFFSTQEWLKVQKIIGRVSCISVSFGKSWLLHPTERTLYPKDPSVPNVLALMAHLEAKHGFNNPTRILLGSSMGGFNALQMYCHAPQMWKAAGIHVPMVLTKNPWNYFDLKLLAAPIVRGSFVKKEWPMCDPLMAGMMKVKPETHPPIHVQVSQNDEFNLFEAGEECIRMLSEHGVLHSHVRGSGKHKDMDSAKMAEFIKQFLGGENGT